MKKRAFLFIIIAGILWGTSTIFVNVLAPFGFSSLHMTFFRAAVSFISLSIYSLIRERKAFKVKIKELVLFAAIGISFFSTASCYYIAMQATSTSTAVVLMYLAPVIVMIFSVIFFGEKITALKIVSVLGMLIGCGLVSGIIGGIVFKPFGIFMGFMSGISYAAYNIFTKIGTKNKCNTISMTLYCFFFALIISFIVCSPMEIPKIISKDILLTLPLAITHGICTCVLPYFLYTLAMKELPAGTASALG